jgi:hypothetical protein
MDSLEKCTRLATLNGCEKYQEILSGSINQLDLEGSEVALAAGRSLDRSSSILTALDLKYMALLIYILMISIYP